MSKNFLFALLFATRLTRLVAWFSRSRVTILCYHSVTRRQDSKLSDPHKLHLHVDSFLRHLDYLQANYRIISLAEFVRARRENIKLPSGTAILTFEDGVRNFFTVVAPILMKRGIPVTSFIVTGENFTKESSTLNGHWSPEDDKSYLSWNEVRKLADQGVEFGSHTCSHQALPELSPDEARDELGKSLKTLTAHLARDTFPLSYPHGRTSKEISQVSELLGYSCALTTELGANDTDCDLFALRRTVIASDDDLPTFAARLSGVTALYARVVTFFNAGTAPAEEPANICYDPIEEFKS